MLKGDSCVNHANVNRIGSVARRPNLIGLYSRNSPRESLRLNRNLVRLNCRDGIRLHPKNIRVCRKQGGLGFGHSFDDVRFERILKALDTPRGKPRAQDFIPNFTGSPVFEDYNFPRCLGIRICVRFSAYCRKPDAGVRESDYRNTRENFFDIHMIYFDILSLIN